MYILKEVIFKNMHPTAFQIIDKLLSSNFMRSLDKR